MFVVIQVGNSQFKVKEGDTIDAHLIDAEEGKNVTLDQVLMVSNGDDIRFGQPFIKGAKVTAKVLSQHKGDKKIAFKYRRRKFSSSKRGHRQKLTALNITKIAI